MATTLAKPQGKRPGRSAHKRPETSLFLLVTSRIYRDFNALASQAYMRSVTRRTTGPSEFTTGEEELVTTPKE